MSRLAPGIAAAKAVGALSRAAGRGGGTSLPGKVLTRLEPRAIDLLAGRLEHGSAVISATNGKTTTAAMVASVLEQRGARLVHNHAGANMEGGIAAALAGAARGGGRRLDGDTGLFEVDEFWLGRLLTQLRPRAVLLANLFRDQLDRYGELETIGDRWRVGRRGAAGAGPPWCSTPTIRWSPISGASATRRTSESPTTHSRWTRCSTPRTPSTAGAAGTRTPTTRSSSGTSGATTARTAAQRRPEPAVYATEVELKGIRAAAFTLVMPEGTARVELPLPGLYNVYNALAAAALTRSLGASPAEIAAGLAAVAPAFGRAETITLAGREASLLLIKNPAGANEVLRTLALEPGDLEVLGVLNDRIADGRDVSWVWDADWEIVAGRIGRMVCAGTRAAELAVRLKYAGVPPERIDGRRRSHARARPGAGGRRGPAVRPAHLHGAARAARAARPPRRRAGLLAMIERRCRLA